MTDRIEASEPTLEEIAEMEKRILAEEGEHPTQDELIPAKVVTDSQDE